MSTACKNPRIKNLRPVRARNWARAHGRGRGSATRRLSPSISPSIANHEPARLPANLRRKRQNSYNACCTSLSKQQPKRPDKPKSSPKKRGLTLSHHKSMPMQLCNELQLLLYDEPLHHFSLFTPHCNPVVRKVTLEGVCDTQKERERGLDSNRDAKESFTPHSRHTADDRSRTMSHSPNRQKKTRHKEPVR